MTSPLSTKDEVVLAALRLRDAGKADFTEWELTVACWKLNPQHWGLPGFRELYPDHKRVMNELMDKGKNRAMTRGLIERVKTNVYRLTEAGIVYARSLEGGTDGTERADYNLYDSLKTYLEQSAFRQYVSDHSRPKIWLYVAGFYGLSASMDAQQASSRVSQFETLLAAGKAMIEKKGPTSIRRVSSGPFISKEDLELLSDFHEEMKSRFSAQFATLMGRI